MTMSINDGGELAAYRHPGNDLAATDNDRFEEALADLERQSRMMEIAFGMGEQLCRSALVPDSYRGKPGDVAIAIMYGASIGLPVMLALQKVISIHGRPSLEARTMLVLVRRAGHTIKVIEHTAERAVVIGWRKGESGDDPYTATWTMDRARQANYVPIPDGNGGYKKNSKGNLLGNMKYLEEPETMLREKAIAEACRQVGPECLLGVEYTPDEIREDPIRVEAQRVTTPSGNRLQEIIGTLAESADSSESGGRTPAEPAADKAGSMADFPITRPQRNTITKLLQEKGYGAGDWPTILAWLVTAQLIDAADGRKVESTADLTSGEGTNVITALNDPARAIAPNGQDQAEQPEPDEADR